VLEIRREADGTFDTWLEKVERGQFKPTEYAVL
jgi:hypothetical protein